MKVSIKNYEVWMIDYFDGKLNAVEKAELMAFIEENPDIKEEFEAFENDGIEIREIIYTAKKQLKVDPIIASSNINEHNYDEFFIAYYENDLNESQQQQLIAFIDLNPSLKSEFSFHGELQVKEPPVIIYENKSGLKRKAAIGIYWQISGIAAALLILFGVFSLFDFDDSGSLNKVENTLPLSVLPKKSININLQSNTIVGIIEKEQQFIELLSVPEEPEPYQLTVLHKFEARSPDISVAEPIESVRLIENESTYFSHAYILANADDVKRKNAFGRIIQNLARKASGKLPDQDSNEKNNDPVFVKALGTGITVFNTITGSDTELVKSYNNQGRLTSYYVEGESIAWSRELAPNEE